MKTLEQGQDKVKHICDILRRETLDPAKQEAEKVIEEARIQAEKIIVSARDEADRMIADSKKKIAQERQVFETSLQQAGKQSLEKLRQAIEKNLFDEQLHDQVKEATKDPKVISTIINILVKAVESEGTGVDLSAYIPKTVKPSEVNDILLDGVLENLREKGVEVSGIAGGAMVRLHDKRIILDLSDTAIKELLGGFLRKDFRDKIFKS